LSCDWLFSGTVTRSAIIDWYPTLVKPVLIPELDFCAGMGTLYIMMGIAAGLVWDRMDKEGVKKALIYLCDNWRCGSYLFFGFVTHVSRAGNYCSVVDDL
jgi:tryptophan-rich sensory protein